MKVALHIPRFTWEGGPAQLGACFGELASAADQAGFSYMSVMDHFFQIPPVGPAEGDMLEAYTTLGYAAANTRRLRLALVERPVELVRRIGRDLVARVAEL